VITNREMAAYLKLAETTTYHLDAEGNIAEFKVGASWRFRKSKLDRWIIAKEQGLA
jgi:excisionase family DNA binding protein